MQVQEKCECQSLKNYDKLCIETAVNINPELKAMIDKIANKEGFSSYKLIVKNATPDGNNYLGVLTEVTIHDNLSNKNHNLFIKSILPSADQLKAISLTDAYCIEVYLYLELSKVLEKLQADANIPLEERYKFVKSYNESTLDHIIMENMIKKGFSTWNRFEVISLEYAEKAIKLLAKFHALGFVLKEKHPIYFKEKIMNLKYPVKLDEDYNKFFMNMANNAFDYLEGSARSKLEQYVTQLLQKAKEYVKDQDSTLTMCHGDFRPNNILIKEESGITDMVPVDYQILNHGSPLIDLMYFIFGATDKEFRRQHLDYLKNLYYDTMTQFLKYFDIDVQKYYPKEEYERLFKERLDFGQFTGVWYLQLNLADKDSIMDFSKSQFSEADFGKNDLAKVRLQELVDDFIKWGYL